MTTDWCTCGCEFCVMRDGCLECHPRRPSMADRPHDSIGGDEGPR